MDKNKLIEMIEDAFGIDYYGFIEEIDEPANWIGGRFLPTNNVYDYDWVYHIFDNTVAIARMISRADGEAPIVGGPAVKKVAGSVAPFGQKFQVNQSMLNKIFNPRNDSELKQNLRRILDESARNVRSAQARREWLRWQVLADGVIEIDDSDAELEVDVGVPNDNNFEATDSGFGLKWDTTWDNSDLTPLSDYIKLCDEYYDINDEMPDVGIMRRAQLLEMTGAETTRDEIGEGSRVSPQALNEYLEEHGYPAIETYDEFVRLEDSQGRPTTKDYLIPEGIVALLQEATTGADIDTDIGNISMGPVAENNFEPGIYTDIYEEFDPLKYWHYMKTECWPAIFNPEKIVIFDALAE